MASEALVERFVNPLLEGRRRECQDVLAEAIQSSKDPVSVYRGLMWPAFQRVSQLYDQGRIGLATEKLASQITRSLADQLQACLPEAEPNGKRVIMCCGDEEPEELGAQMCADLFEADGWEVYFLGTNVPNDEILALAGRLRPDLLIVFGTQPQGVERTGQLIGLIREIGATPSMNIMIAGGVFRTPGRAWEKLGPDLFAPTAAEVLDLANKAKPRKAEAPASAAPPKRRRKRRPAATEPAKA